uniref:ER membrane protein complex subunit 3 n=1 Tax=Spongospora subterranea TaxID=70186 RepID=A0A0H5QKB7_9EUKA|eukprot:CRZ02570.1 hypothetical protein [Spongospora subterranea]
MVQYGLDQNTVLSLDPRIRDYVLLPICVFVIMQGILRHFVSILLQTQPRKPKRNEIRHGELLRRAKLFRNNSQFLNENAFQSRRISLIDNFKVVIEELKPKEESTSPDAPMQMPVQNPEDLQSMLNMMKQNFANVIPNMLSMAWISYFFSGFILVKLPFPLTQSFKGMLQQGISISHLDPSYVSSLSWYFINLFGTRGLLSLCLGKYPADETQEMYSQMTVMPTAGPMNTGTHKPFEQEKIELEISKLISVVDDAENRLLGKLPRKAHND